ncbi:Aste57867_15314 [Aphanomyces stellatus]|uniref:Aste57867_15314 protein n=1 Tax=Aphanomyces stellatus TaxID=120398 RepID=A0A485L3G1_9STRA|nr:hypothetical protein As57867_015258 [Aphanomyces stellatus]VFT92123.1 Aste57867_15314 [Aphanomyces stellatus]
MKLLQLGHAEEGVSSFLIGTSGRQVLLDCGLNMKALVHLPLHGPCRFHGPSLHAVDAETIDYVVISNHLSLLGLPLLTERSSFKGAIYATEPCVRFGRRMLLELLDILQRRRGGNKTWMSRADIKTLSFPDQQLLLGMEYEKWAEPYTRHEIEQCLARITLIPYCQTLSLTYELKLTAVSSGFALGSCCWVLESPMEKLVYVPAASSEVNRHPAALDMHHLRDADIMLVTDLKTDRDTHMIDKRLETFLSHLVNVYNRKGISLVPCLFDGVLFDLLENLQLYLKAMGQLAPIPIYFVTAAPLDAAPPVAPQWLCDSKVQKLYTRESPFVHASLVDQGTLRLVPPGSPVPLDEPCVIFANHPSLRFGDVVDLVPRLQSHSANAVIFIDPHVQPAQAIAPFQPNVLMEVIHAPIDFRLSCNNANMLIAECKPQTVVVPACYTQHPGGDAQAVRKLHELLVTRDEDATVLLHHLQPVVVSKAKKIVDAILDPELAAQTNLTLVDKQAAALVQATLSLSSSHGLVEVKPVAGDYWTHSLDLAGATGAPSKKLCVREKTNILLGDLDLNALFEQLQMEFGPMHIEERAPNNAVTVASFRDTVLTFIAAENKTIISSNDDHIRDRVSQLVVSQLVRF